MAVILAIGRLNDGREIAALQVCGISLYRIAIPLVLLGAIIAIANVTFEESIVARGNDRYRELFNDFLGRAHGHAMTNVMFRAAEPDGGSIYYARQYDPNTKTFEHITLSWSDQHHDYVTYARTATYDHGNLWRFHDGHVYIIGQEMVVTKFTAMDVELPRTPKDVALSTKAPTEMSLVELRAASLHAQRDGEDPRQYVSEFHSRISVQASCIFFALIGLPLGLRSQKSGPGIGVGISILVVLGYYAVMIPSQIAAEGKTITPVLAAWLPNGVVGTMGSVLLVRAR